MNKGLTRRSKSLWSKLFNLSSLRRRKKKTPRIKEVKKFKDEVVANGEAMDKVMDMEATIIKKR